MFESLGDLVALRLLALHPESPAGEALQFFVMGVTKIFVLLAIVIYVMGLLGAMLSPERVREFVRCRPDWQARGKIQRQVLRQTPVVSRGTARIASPPGRR